jgi:hypothetical protein
MHPLLRNVVIGIVGLIIATALAALALIGRDSRQSVPLLVAAGVLGAVVGVFLFSQAWTWSGRAARRRDLGAAVLIAVGGGMMAVVAAVALAGLLILVLVFILG